MKKIDSPWRFSWLPLIALMLFSSCELSKDDDDDETPGEPVASFQFEVSADDWAEVTFTNFSQNATSYSWDFGDDSELSTEENPVHTYSGGGTYTVTLTAANADGVSATKSETVDITDPLAAQRTLFGEDGKTWHLLADVEGGTKAVFEVGPTDRSAFWWAFGISAQICERSCIFNDTWTFNPDGTFTFDNQGDAFAEGAFKADLQFTCFDATVAENWVGENGEDLSGWDSGTHGFTYDAAEATIEIDGGFIGLPKATPDGEVTAPAGGVKYNVVKLVDAEVDTLIVEVEFANSDSPSGLAFWRSTLVSYSEESQIVTVGECEVVESGTPEVEAPAPTVAAENVISIYSDAYTSIDGVNLNPDWSQSTALTEETIGEGNMLKLASFNYQGIDFAGNAQDLSTAEMNFLHLDMWTSNAEAVNVFLISEGAETPVALDIAASTWKGYDIALSEFSEVVDITGVIQLKFDGGEGQQTIFLDNIYFYAGESQSAPATAAPTPTQAAEDVISIYSDAYTSIDGVDTNPNWSQATVVTGETVEGDNMLKLAGLNYQGIDWANNMQDVSGKTHLHLDVWTADATTVNLSLISDGPLETPYALAIETGQWVSYDIPLSEYTSVVDLTKTIQIKFDDAEAGNSPTLFVDNIYFY